MLKFIAERKGEYDANTFINDMASASKSLGVLEAKINAYQFNSILIPVLHKKEAISSMYIEGTQTTISDVYENEINPRPEDEKIMIEVHNHNQALAYGAECLLVDVFSHCFIQKIHEIMMENLISPDNLGKYKTAENRIVNGKGTVVFTPPPPKYTRKYMDELIRFMNTTDDNIHPLIKAAIVHSQFESIHPFKDGNGRVGRLIVSLYLYKSRVINFPFFYISEAICADKRVYYNMLSNSRGSSYDEWIKYFLRKIQIQTSKYISYIDSLNNLYITTRKKIQEFINIPKFEIIIEYLFTHPILTAAYFAERLNVSQGQAVRYLNALEKNGIIQGDDRKRGRKFYFSDLIELANLMQ